MNVNKAVTRLIGFSVIGLALGACSSGDPDSSAPVSEGEPSQVADLAEITIEGEEALKPIARVDVNGVGSVRFYEPSPGQVLIGHGGVADAELLGPETVDMTVVEKFEHLANSPAPQALVDAMLRAEQRAAESPENTASEAADAESVRPRSASQTKSHGDWFTAPKCDLHNQSSADHKAFWVNVTGTGSFTWTKLDWVQSSARSRQGTIRFRARVKTCLLCSWGSYASQNLGPGQAWTWSYSDGKNFQFNSIVDNADGDVYDFCSIGMN